MLQGEALFVVERDAARPFIVSTDAATVRAVGTQFNVHREAGATRVAVVEGIVEVVAEGEVDFEGPSQKPSAATNPSGNALRLAAGEEATVARGAVRKRALPVVDDAIAWRHRRLVFRDAPLSQVAAEFNRYNRAQIRLEGDALRNRQLTGIFSADHPQSVVLYLSQDESLEVRPAGNAWVIRER